MWILVDGAPGWGGRRRVLLFDSELRDVEAVHRSDRRRTLWKVIGLRLQQADQARPHVEGRVDLGIVQPEQQGDTERGEL